MHIEIEIDNVDRPQWAVLNLPECWNDVDPLIFPALATLYLQKLPPADKTVRAFTLLAREAWETISMLNADELYTMLPAIDWVFSKLDLSKNLLPVLRINETDFIGPADELENLRFAEWCAADTFFVNYSETEDLHQLHQLAAVLYRPAGEGDEYNPDHRTWRGDTREKFNDQLLKSRTGLMATLPEPVIKGIYLFYSSCRHRIIADYPETFKKKKSESGDTVGWLDIYDDLRADPKYTGAGVLDEEFLHSCFFSLERSNIKMEKLKAQYDI